MLAIAEPKGRRRFLLGWSTWRRAHQAVAARCRKASLAAKRAALCAERPPEVAALAPEEAHLTDEQWALVRPLLPPQRGGVGRPRNDHRVVLGGILWVVEPAPPGGRCRRNSASGRVRTGATSCGRSRACGSVSFER